MSKYTFGVPVVSAVITTTDATGKETSTAVKAGDSLTDLTILNYPENIKIASATVKGFTLKAAELARNCTTIYDGVPTYQADNNFQAYGQTAEEVTQIAAMVVEVPGEKESDPSMVISCPISKVVSFTAAAGDESSDDTTDTEGDDVGNG